MDKLAPLNPSPYVPYRYNRHAYVRRDQPWTRVDLRTWRTMREFLRAFPDLFAEMKP